MLNSLNTVLVTVNDSLYAPLYVEKIVAQVKEEAQVDISCVYVLNTTKGQKLWKQLKRRWGIYGLSQFLLFILLVLKSKLLAKLEPIFPFRRPYSIKRLCRKKGIRYIEITNVNAAAFIEELRSNNVEVLVSIAIPQRFKLPILEAVPYPLNVHSSLLPKYAGVMGLFWAVVHQETEAGVSLFIMDEKFDNGDILGQVSFPTQAMNSLHQLYLQAIEHGSKLITSVLVNIAQGNHGKIEQNLTERSYFSFPAKDDRRKFFQLGYKFFRWKDFLT